MQVEQQLLLHTMLGDKIVFGELITTVTATTNMVHTIA